MCVWKEKKSDGDENCIFGNCIWSFFFSINETHRVRVNNNKMIMIWFVYFVDKQKNNYPARRRVESWSVAKIKIQQMALTKTFHSKVSLIIINWLQLTRSIIISLLDCSSSFKSKGQDDDLIIVLIRMKNNNSQHRQAELWLEVSTEPVSIIGNKGWIETTKLQTWEFDFHICWWDQCWRRGKFQKVLWLWGVKSLSQK